MMFLFFCFQSIAQAVWEYAYFLSILTVKWEEYYLAKPGKQVEMNSLPLCKINKIHLSPPLTNQHVKSCVFNPYKYRSVKASLIFVPQRHIDKETTDTKDSLA